jgi:hypothetical protein
VPLITPDNYKFRKFAAILPHIAWKAFVQSIYPAVAATKNVVAKGHLA